MSKRSTCVNCGDAIEYNEGERTVMGSGLPWWSHVPEPGTYGRIYCGVQYGTDKAATPLEGDDHE